MHSFLSGSGRCPRRQPIFCWLDFPSASMKSLIMLVRHLWPVSVKKLNWTLLNEGLSVTDINETLMTRGWRVELCGCLTAQNTDFICVSEMFSAFWGKCSKGFSKVTRNTFCRPKTKYYRLNRENKHLLLSWDSSWLFSVWLLWNM